MELYIIRHATAVPTVSTDAERPLSADGKTEAAALGKFLAKVARVDVLLSSPLVRARRTAEAIGPYEAIPCLAPGASPVQIQKAIEPYGDKNIAIVGHQPDMGRFVSFLISGGSMELQVALKPGAVCRVDVDRVPLRAPGRLIWLVEPTIIL